MKATIVAFLLYTNTRKANIQNIMCMPNSCVTIYIFPWFIIGLNEIVINVGAYQRKPSYKFSYTNNKAHQWSFLCAARLQ